MGKTVVELVEKGVVGVDVVIWMLLWLVMNLYEPVK